MARPAHGKDVTVAFHGEVDMSCSQEITTRIGDAIETAGATRVTIDLADVRFLDCHALGLLIDAHRAAAERGVELRLIHPDAPIVRRLLDATATLPVLGPTAASARHRDLSRNRHRTKEATHGPMG